MVDVVYGGHRKLRLVEGYIQYEAESNAVRLVYEDGSSIFLNSDDVFEALIDGNWDSTWVYLSSNGWAVAGEKGDMLLVGGEKVKVRYPTFGRK